MEYKCPKTDEFKLFGYVSYKGDVEKPKGGVRGVIPNKQSYSTEKKPYSKESPVPARRGQKWGKEDDEKL